MCLNLCNLDLLRGVFSRDAPHSPTAEQRFSPEHLKADISQLQQQTDNWQEALRSDFSDLEFLFKNSHHLDAFCNLCILVRKLDDRKSFQDLCIKDKIYYKTTQKQRLAEALEADRRARVLARRSWVLTPEVPADMEQRRELKTLALRHHLEESRLRRVLEEDKRWLTRFRPALSTEDASYAAELTSEWNRAVDLELRTLSKQCRDLRAKITRRERKIVAIFRKLGSNYFGAAGAAAVQHDSIGDATTLIFLLEYDKLVNNTRFRGKVFGPACCRSAGESRAGVDGELDARVVFDVQLPEEESFWAERQKLKKLTECLRVDGCELGMGLSLLQCEEGVTSDLPLVDSLPLPLAEDPAETFLQGVTAEPEDSIPVLVVHKDGTLSVPADFSEVPETPPRGQQPLYSPAGADIGVSEFAELLHTAGIEPDWSDSELPECEYWLRANTM